MMAGTAVWAWGKREGMVGESKEWIVDERTKGIHMLKGLKKTGSGSLGHGNSRGTQGRDQKRHLEWKNYRIRREVWKRKVVICVRKQSARFYLESDRTT